MCFLPDNRFCKRVGFESVIKSNNNGITDVHQFVICCGDALVPQQRIYGLWVKTWLDVTVG